MKYLAMGIAIVSGAFLAWKIGYDIGWDRGWESAKKWYRLGL